MLKKYVFPLLASCCVINASYAKDDIRIPNQALHYAYTSMEDGMTRTTVFQGKMQLEGKLFLNWYDNDLAVSFIPSAISRKKLPYINDNYNEKNIEIGINSIPLSKDRVRNTEGIWEVKNHPLPDNVALIKPYFPDIPATFWQKKTGKFTVPAEVTITEFGMEIECDSRNYYATAVAIRPLGQKSALKVPEGY